MKSILTCLLSVLLCATVVFAQQPTDTKVRTGPAALADTKKRLVLTTSIVKRSSCGPNHLALDLKLRFQNTGRDPVIPGKRIMLGRFMVSRNLDDAAAEKYALSIRYTDFDEEPGFGQIAVGTWPYVADPEPIQQGWKGKGFLWTDGLLSEPMPFTVDKNEPITKCP